MRRYKIEITREGKPIVDKHGKPLGPYDSHSNPQCALHVAFDLPVITADIGITGGQLAIYGLPASAICQDVDLWMANITIEAGFEKRLPLAPERCGVILTGQIFNAYGNWQGTNQSLNIVIGAGSEFDANGNIISIKFRGKKGEKLKDVLFRCLTDAYKNTGKVIKVFIDEEITLYEDYNGVDFARLSNLAHTLRGMTQSNEINIATQGSQITVWDKTHDWKSGIKEIGPLELIGQPTWIDHGTISFKTTIRNDIMVGDTIHLPPSITSGKGGILSVSSGSRLKPILDELSFSGNFMVKGIRHIGEYRNPSADAWVTVFEAASLLSGKSTKVNL